MEKFQDLKTHFEELKKETLIDLFKADPNRFSALSEIFDGILFDFSKHRITEDTLTKLIALAEAMDLTQKIKDMFSGKRINNTENRPVLHVALRKPDTEKLVLDGEDVVPMVKSVLEKMRVFTDKVRDGSWRGVEGGAITDVVNIGIGGSDLGPKMAVQALLPFQHQRLNIHYVSNVDGTHIMETLKKLDYAKTLFIICSKTFTTQETLTNANTAKAWFLRAGDLTKRDPVVGDAEIAKHFVAVSTNKEAVKAFGIDPENMFEFWNWVGGRYSLWSAVGLSLVLSIGMGNFESMLAGANSMDNHFKDTPLRHNVPVLMGLIGFWYNNLFKAETCAVLPYDQYLSMLPKYLQQLDMESNGKGKLRNGGELLTTTGPIIWGEPGTDGQHAFYQLIHQGTKLIPCDFIATCLSHNDVGEHHKILLSNFFAQTEALMIGRSREKAVETLKSKGYSDEEIKEAAPHNMFEGNRPTTSILLPKVTPYTFGELVALYEHKVYVMGVLFGINSFDQPGVELGKILAKEVLKELNGIDKVAAHDSSTNGLINYYKSVVYE